MRCTVRKIFYSCVRVCGKRPRCVLFLKRLIKLVLAVTLLLYIYILLVKKVHIPKLSFSFRNRSEFVRIFPDTKRNVNKTIKVLLWTTWFGTTTWGVNLDTAFKTCPVSNCVLTNKRSDLKSADVLLFHHGDLYETNLPCSIFSYNELPVYRRSDQVWIVLTQEPYSEYCRDDSAFNGVFNWTATYRRDSDIYLPYAHVTKRQTEYNVGNVSSTKTAGIAWMAGNCIDDSRRQLLVKEIQKYVPVDKYGFCGFKKLPRSATLRHYKFYLSFENSFCRDYITEKFFSRLMHHVLPIVSGGGDYSKVAPPHSYIDVRDFESVKDLVDYIQYLDSNDTAYNSYFDWTRKYVVLPPNKWCSICEAVHDDQKPLQVYNDLEGWFGDDTCKQLTVLEEISRHIEGRTAQLGIT